MVGMHAGYPGDGVTATAIAERCQSERKPSTMLVTSNDKGKWFYGKEKCQAFRGSNSIEYGANLQVSRAKQFF